MTTLVLLPGLDGTPVLFGPLRAALAALPTPIAVHAVAYPPQATDYAALLPLARAACERFDDCFVLGWSFSGPLAIELAAAPPRGLRGAILVATFAQSPWPLGRWLAPMMRPALARLGPIGSRLLGTARGELGAQLRRDKRQAWAQLLPSTLAGRVRSILRVDAHAALRACRLPLLAFASSRDLVVPPWNARSLQRSQRRMQLCKLRGGHLALYTQATAAAARIAEFTAAAPRHGAAAP